MYSFISEFEIIIKLNLSQATDIHQTKVHKPSASALSESSRTNPSVSVHFSQTRGRRAGDMTRKA